MKFTYCKKCYATTPFKDGVCSICKYDSTPNDNPTNEYFYEESVLYTVNDVLKWFAIGLLYIFVILLLINWENLNLYFYNLNN